MKVNMTNGMPHNFVCLFRYVSYALVPALVLLLALFVATVLSYFIVHFLSDTVPLRQLISRITQGLLVLSIFPLLSYLKINKQDFGYAPLSLFFKQLGLGFGMGFIVLIPVFLVLYFLNIIVINKAQPWGWGIMSTTLIINLGLALLIALVEESLFRGLLWSSLSKKLPAIMAVMLSAIYFAGLHFLTTKTNLPTSTLTIWSGFGLWPEAFSNVISSKNASGLIALLMVGIFLALLRTQYSVSLGVCIGCHCCWVWQIKTCKKFFYTDFSSPYHDWVSSYDGITGPLVSIWLAVIILLYFTYRYLVDKSRLSH